MIGNWSYTGVFLPRDASSVGHLTVAGKNSSLTLIGKEMAARADAKFVDIQGALSNGKKASLLDCVLTGESHHYLNENFQYATDFFPNYVVIGEEFITSNEPVVRAVHYHFENVHHLVDGHKAFLSLHPSPEEARAILEADHRREEQIAEKNGWEKREFDPQIGDHPHFLYYSGKWEVVECQTDIGKVSLVNRVSGNIGSSKGIGIENEVTVVIEFTSPKTVKDTIHALYSLHGLFELAIGARQRYKWIELELTQRRKDDGRKSYKHAKLFWSNCNDCVDDEYKSDLALLSADLRPVEFSKVVTNWLNTYPTMGVPRERFATAFFGPFSPNRIVGAANMFDLLPESHAPKKKEAAPETKSAVRQCREIFDALPDSFAKQSVLSSLGRVGTASLRDKVYHRADIVIAAGADRYAELKLPCSHAVLCRNHYVHGSDASFNYREHFNEYAFITETLEFVFAVADLIELGWDFAGWRKRGATFGNPLAAYTINYEANLRQLKNILGVSDLS